jgi:hypothetical protein
MTTNFFVVSEYGRWAAAGKENKEIIVLVTFLGVCPRKDAWLSRLGMMKQQSQQAPRISGTAGPKSQESKNYSR